MYSINHNKSSLNLSPIKITYILYTYPQLQNMFQRDVYVQNDTNSFNKPVENISKDMTKQK